MALPIDAPTPRLASAPSDHRTRLLHALAQALEHSPYQAITVADVIALARVSKRTFYEQFDTKDACLLALCVHTSEQVMAAILAAYRPGAPWRDTVSGVTQAYLGTIGSAPTLMRALYIDLLSVGTPGMVMRREISHRFADFLCAQVAMVQATGEPLRTLERPVAVAVVAGVNELILQAIMADPPTPLMALAGTAEALVHAVTRA